MLQRIKEHPHAALSGFVIIIAGIVFLLTRTPVPQIMTAEEVKAQIRQETVERGVRVHGSVVAVTDATLTVRTGVVNLDTFEHALRDVVIALAPETEFVGFIRNDLSPGVVVTVALDASIYDTESPTAKSIERVDLKTQAIQEVTNFSMIAATVAEVQGQTLVVETSIADKEKLKTLDSGSGELTIPYVAKRYTVTVTPNTEFLEGKTFADVRFGSSLNIWGGGNLYTVDSFEATKIYIAP